MVSLKVYDRANGIGGNKIYLEEKGKSVFLDFGKNFSKYGFFYENFLKSRDTRGIHDLVHLDLLPKLNIYRPDLIPSDLSTSRYLTLNVAAVLLSHAHMDHCGNIGFLRNDIPIVASPESIVIMKGMQDAGISSLEAESAYFSPRQSGRRTGPVPGICGQHELPGQRLLLHRAAIRGSDLFSQPKAGTGFQEGQKTGAWPMLLLRHRGIALRDISPSG
jgi:hypothetical protein